MTNADLRVGQVLTTQNGERYAVVISDEFGAKDVINLRTACSNGLVVSNVAFAVSGGNSSGGRDIVKIQEFTASPSRNRLSEALKILIDREPCYELATIWEKESQEVKKLKEEKSKLLKQFSDLEKSMKDIDMAILNLV